MTAHDRTAWEERWQRALARHGGRIADRPPSTRLTGEVADLPPGRALDAGCGHGAEAVWLASRGWRVTAVDFAAPALETARATAAALGPEVAERVEWVQADLSDWRPPERPFDLVACLFVHVAGSVEAFVGRMGAAVAPGGTLLLAGHRPVDPDTGEPTAAADQVQVSVEAARAALALDRWELVVAEERRRTSGPGGVDAVVRARRRAVAVPGDG